MAWPLSLIPSLPLEQSTLIRTPGPLHKPSFWPGMFSAHVFAWPAPNSISSFGHQLRCRLRGVSQGTLPAQHLEPAVSRAVPSATVLIAWKASPLCPWLSSPGEGKRSEVVSVPLLRVSQQREQRLARSGCPRACWDARMSPSPPERGARLGCCGGWLPARNVGLVSSQLPASHEMLEIHFCFLFM